MNNDRRKTINSLISQLEEVLEELNVLESDEREANEAKPESLQNEDAADLLSNAVTDLENTISNLGEAAE